MSFARSQRLEFLTAAERELDDETSAQADEEGLWSTIRAMEGSRHPATHRITQSSEQVLEDGYQVQPLQIA